MKNKSLFLNKLIRFSSGTRQLYFLLLLSIVSCGVGELCFSYCDSFVTYDAINVSKSGESFIVGIPSVKQTYSYQNSRDEYIRACEEEGDVSYNRIKGNRMELEYFLYPDITSMSVFSDTGEDLSDKFTILFYSAGDFVDSKYKIAPAKKSMRFRMSNAKGRITKLILINDMRDLTFGTIECLDKTVLSGTESLRFVFQNKADKVFESVVEIK